MIIDALVANEGNARRILGVQGDDELDLSADKWESRREVLRGLEFENARLTGKRVRPNFVECSFRECSFRDLRSEGTFWGTSDLWISCEFEEIRLEDTISPQNRFVGCQFKDVTLRRYQPAETVFIDCIFENLTLEGLKVQPNMRNRTVRSQMANLWPYPEIAELDARRLSLLFRGCRFETPVFRHCAFEHTSFDDSIFIGPKSEASTFTRVQGESRWWVAAEEGENLSRAYMAELLRLIDDRLGEHSWSANRLRGFLQNYKGSHVESDWFEDLVENGIPRAEYEVVEAIVDSLERSFHR